MPVIHAAKSVVHQIHGATINSYAAPALGSKELCAWHIEIPPRTEGVPHHVSREEVWYILSGTVHANIDDRSEEATAGDVIVVPTGSRMRVDTGDTPMIGWVTTSVGTASILADGSWLLPPWTL